MPEPIVALTRDMLKNPVTISLQRKAAPAAGITQATNALALDTCCDVPKDTTIAYSTAQQLIITAWNVLFATLLVVVIFGWTGGKQIVGDAYGDAKERAADMKQQRKEKRQAKRQAKLGRLHGGEEEATGPDASP